MDILKFVNSKDIREHLRKLNYQFASLEAAWLVWQSKYTTLQEKHEAWEEIIRTMPNCEIEIRRNVNSYSNLHAFLKKLMEIENSVLESIQQEEGMIYSYSVFDTTEWEDDCGLYSDFKLCMKEAKNYIVAIAWFGDVDLSHARIDVKQLRLNDRGSINHLCSVEYNGYGEVLRIAAYGSRGSDEEYERVYNTFQEMTFTFPIPFKKGDIVSNCIFLREPFVFDDLEFEDNIESDLKRDGSMDVIVHGYFQNQSTGEIFYGTEYTYMDMEYYEGDLQREKRVLKSLSNYLKGNIRIDLFANAYKAIVNKEQVGNILAGYRNEELELAGLKE